MLTNVEPMLILYSQSYLSFVVYNLDNISCVYFLLCCFSFCYLLVMGGQSLSEASERDECDEAVYTRGFAMSEFVKRWLVWSSETLEECLKRRCFGDFMTGPTMMRFRGFTSIFDDDLRRFECIGDLGRHNGGSSAALFDWNAVLRVGCRGGNVAALLFAVCSIIKQIYRSFRLMTARNGQFGVLGLGRAALLRVCRVFMRMIFLSLGASILRSARSAFSRSAIRVGVRKSFLSSPWRV